MADVNVDLEVNTKDALKEINRFSQQASKSLESIDSGISFTELNQAIELLFKGFDVIQGAVESTVVEFANFESALVGVQKTTNLSDKQTEALGESFRELALRIPVASDELLAVAESAGQLGVTGSEAILNFTETIARLGVASDVSGQEAATALARILKVTGETTNEVDELASVVVALGNSFEATESEILRVTNEVARGIGVFGASSGEAAALATTLRSLGVRAELAGGVTTRAFQEINNAIVSGGDKLQTLSELTGKTGAELKKAFAEDSVGVFRDFIAGVGELESSQVNLFLENFGLAGTEVAKVLPTLAKNVESFDRALEIQNKEIQNSTALVNESNKAFETTASRFKILQNNVRDVGLSFGEALNPFIVIVIDEATRLINIIGRIVGNFDNLVVTINNGSEEASKSFESIVTDGIDFVIDAIPTLIRSVGFIENSFRSLSLIPDLIVRGFLELESIFLEILDIASNFEFLGIDDVTEDLKENELAIKANELAIKNQTRSIKDNADSYELTAQNVENFITSLEVQRAEQAKAAEEIAKATGETEKAAEAQNKLKKEVDDTTKSVTQLNAKALATDEQKKQVADLQKSLSGVRSNIQKAIDEADPIGAIQRQSDETEEILRKSLENRLISETEYNSLVIKNQINTQEAISTEAQKINKDKLEAIEKQEKDARDKIIKNTQAGFVGIIGDSITTANALFQNFFDEQKINIAAILPDPQELAAQALGATNQLLKGAEGAQQFLVQGASVAADAFLPGLGQAVGPLVEALSQGPEFVRQQVEAFADALPVLLDNIARAVPVLVESLAEAAPDIIVALVKAAPAISKAIILSLQRLPFILAQEFAIAISEEIDKAFGTTISTDFEAAAERFAGTTEDLQEKYISSVEDGVDKILGNFQNGLNQFTATFQTFFANIGSGISTAVSDIGTQLTGVFTTAASVLASPFDTFTETVNKLGGLVGNIGSDFLAEFDRIVRDLFAFSFPSFPELTLPEIPQLKLPDVSAALKAPINAIIDVFNSLKIPELRASGKVLGKSFDFPLIPATDLIPGDIPKLRTGGRVPEGFPNDDFFAGLTSNEEVLDTSTSQQLRDFLSEQDQGRDVNITLQIGEKQLADVLLNINRQGFRVVP